MHFLNISTSKSAVRRFYILSSKSCSRHNHVHFFNSSTSKSAPMLIFFTFGLGNVLSTAACTFNELNFHKSDNDMFLAVWHRNVLRATTACKLWSLIWRDGSAPATLASLLFDPLEPQNIGKTTCFATFLPFRAPGSSFYWLFLFWLLLFWLFLFSDCCHLCFSICPFCRMFDFQTAFDQYRYQWKIPRYSHSSPLYSHDWPSLITVSIVHHDQSLKRPSSILSPYFVG